MMTIKQINEISDVVYEMGSVAFNFGGMDFTDLEHVTRRAFKDGDKVLFFVTENQNKKLKYHFEKNNLGKNIVGFKQEKEIIDYCFYLNGIEFVCSIQIELENSLMIHSSLEPQKCVLIKETE
jgi:hypothetical protein